MSGADVAGSQPPWHGTPRAHTAEFPAAPRPSDPPRSAREALRCEVHLACIAGPDIGAVLPLTEQVVLGRQGDVQLSTASASRRHARVVPLPPRHARGRHGEGLRGGDTRGWGRRGRGRRRAVARVEDLGSANGTTVEHPGLLRRGVVVRPAPAPAEPLSGPPPAPVGSTPTPLPASSAGSTTTGPGRGAQSRHECLRVGSRLRIGEDVFEVRERPEALTWPGPPTSRRVSPMGLAPVTMLVAFLLWRLWVMGGAHTTLLLAGPMAAAVLVVLGVGRSRRSRRWARWDGAHLALVLASMEATGPRAPGWDVGSASRLLASHQPGPRVAWLWPGRTGTHGALPADLVPDDGGGGVGGSGFGSVVPGGPGTGNAGRAARPPRTGPARGATKEVGPGVGPGGGPGGGAGDGAAPDTLRRVGMVGPRALEAALWWCAQVAARTGGAVVQVPPDGTVGQMRAVGGGAVPADAQGGEVEDLFVLGDGRTPVHVVDSDHCPHCEQDGGSHSGASAGAHSPLPGHDMEAAHPPTGTGTGTDRAAPVALHVGIAESYRGLPTWCDRVVEDPGPPISPLWWRQVARACATDPSAEGNQEGLPSRVLLAELTDLLTDPLLPQAGEADGGGPHASTSGPDEDGPTGLPALIGMGEGGPVTIDLVRDGPHALLAGTTGSGKSEALATWLLSLTGHHSPDRLRLVLIDYKGGAALRPFATLPHTEEVLTDLDPSATDRALTGLGALLVRREREMADVGVPDLARWELAHAQGRAPTPPPRVLVVVDEFRILADSHPSTLEALVRLAAQGRSLGLHLIAATQRPAGALTPAMRANVEIRLALRCAEEVDSLDVLGSALAARLPRLPGRAVLRGGGILQIAWVPDIDREVAEVAHRWARRPADDDPPGTSCAHGTAGDDTRAHAACADAGPVDRTGATSFPTPGPGRDMLGSRARLWAPDLPGHCSWVDVPGMQLPVSGSGDATTLPPPLPVALADRISGTSQGPLLWRSGGVSVEGPAHRTTELETVALALGTRIAAGRGLPLHVCSGAPTRPPGCATWIRPDDPGPVAMLLEGVLQHGPAVLVTTDIQTMNEGIDLCLGPGQGRAWWGRILSCADRAGVVLIVARTNDAAGAVGGGTPHLPHRLIHVGNSEEALRSGLPSSVPTSLLPGRVLVRGFDEDASGNLRCQVPLEPYPTVATPLAPTPAHAAPPWCVRSEPGGDEPLPDWALGWAGPELLPLKVPGDLDWVVVAADPGPALARLAALRGRGEDSAPPTPDAVHVPRATARPQVAPTHGVTVVHPDQWPTLHALGSRPLIALDPGAELVRMLAASLRGVPPSLRAMEWGPRCGVLAHAGKLTRLVLPPR